MQWYWIRYYVFDWFISLIIIKVFCLLYCHRVSAYSGFICSTRLFSTSDKKTREREWLSKQCQKLRSNVKESFVKLVNFLSNSIYIYTYIYVYIYIYVYKYMSDVAFSVWYLRFSIYWQYFFFLNLPLNLSSFCSLLCSFTTLLPHFRVEVPLFVKHNTPQSSTNKAWFRKFCKRLSVYTWFIRCFREKQFY